MRDGSGWNSLARMETPANDTSATPSHERCAEEMEHRFYLVMLKMPDYLSQTSNSTVKTKMIRLFN